MGVPGGHLGGEQGRDQGPGGDGGAEWHEVPAPGSPDQGDDRGEAPGEDGQGGGDPDVGPPQRARPPPDDQGSVPSSRPR